MGGKTFLDKFKGEARRKGGAGRLIIKRFQRSYYVQFLHVDSDLDILFEKLTAQIGS